MKADTHMHSTFSDGTYFPAQIAEIARKEGLDLIALTDHNTVAGIRPFASCARYYGLKALAGMEITTEYRGTEIHLLSYFPLDTDFSEKEYEPLTKTLDGIRERKVQSNKDTLARLSADFPGLSYEGFMEKVSKNDRHASNLNRMHIADYLISSGTVPDRKTAFDLLEEGGKYYRSSRREGLLETVKTVVSCGGFPTIAHLVQYEKSLSDQDLQDMLNDVASVNGQFGVEIFHFKHHPEQIEKYMGMCRKTGADIVFTAGSDCHGAKKPNRIGYPYDFELDERYSALYSEISEKLVRFFSDKGWI